LSSDVGRKPPSRALGSLTFEHVNQQQALQTYLRALDLLDRRMRRLSATSTAAATKDGRGAAGRALRCSELVAEIGTDWSPFKTGPQFMSYFRRPTAASCCTPRVTRAPGPRRVPMVSQSCRPDRSVSV
jgi:hypothetical protein